MKALILAAGLGTRLLPHTAHRPKPLFTLSGVPLVALTIERLIHAGCERIVVNTHHLHDQVAAFIRKKSYPIPVETRHEPILLDTGGAIKNVKDIMGDSHFWVINSDIVTDLDLKTVWAFHMNGHWPATLVLHDHPRFNGVLVNDKDFITGFPGITGLTSTQYPDLHTGPHHPSTTEGAMATTATRQRMAFTGIQILSPAIFDHMPDQKIFSSIDLYKTLCGRGDEVKAFVADHFYWQDIGTPETYGDAALRQLFMTARATGGGPGPDNVPAAGDDAVCREITITPLAGDGSDRKWHRLTHGGTSFVVADHGIDPLPMDASPPFPREMDAFIHIGTHLHQRQLPVPEIRGYDLFSGLVILEDLGDVHLRKQILESNDPHEILWWYRAACDLVIDFSIQGAKRFDTGWTYQTPDYSRELILEKECRYFVDAFLREYLNLNIEFDALLPPFEFIADACLGHAFTGLMHRDMQSRNLMITQNRLRIIDFQSARKGPLQYDVASLLIDPYVQLDAAMKDTLLEHCAKAVNQRTGFDETRFKKGYDFCALTRNFQILGAFSHLSRNRGKTWFEPFICPAVKTLATAIHAVDIPDAGLLKKTIALALEATHKRSWPDSGRPEP